MRSTEVLTRPFLTELDPRARDKGSRDPLGLQAIWSRLGRYVVGNLTTVTSSVPDFATVLMGVGLIERISDGSPSGQEVRWFLVWEQLAAYSRAHCNSDKAMRGTRVVQRQLSRSSAITIGPGQEHQILSDQKTYGLWGLYTSPSRVSGILDREGVRLTPAARDLFEEAHEPTLRGAFGVGLRTLTTWLTGASRTIHVSGAHAEQVKAVARLLGRKLTRPERDFYRDHLVNGGPYDAQVPGGTQGRQHNLAGLMLAAPAGRLSPTYVRTLATSAARPGPFHDEELARRLHVICDAEALLGPVDALFSGVLAWDGQRLANVSKSVLESWGTPFRNAPDAVELMKDDIIAAQPEDSGALTRWRAIAEALRAGDYANVIRDLLEQNASVMRWRGSPLAWAELGPNEKLKVRNRLEDSQLPDAEDLKELWSHPYFLDSLRSVATRVGVV